MVKVTPDEFAEDWASRLAASTDKIRRGVDKVDVAPSKKAIEKKDKLKQRLIEAIDKGVWERELGKYTLDEWKEDMKTKAITRIPSGAEAAKTKMREFAEKLLPHVEAGQRKIAEMPDLTLEDSINRMTTFVRHMAQFKYKKA